MMNESINLKIFESKIRTLYQTLLLKDVRVETSKKQLIMLKDLQTLFLKMIKVWLDDINLKNLVIQRQEEL